MTKISDTKEIRKQLKESLGFNAKQVSVKQNHSQITFTIRDSKVSKKAIENFGSTYESIRRDYATGDILCGGNTFIRVAFADSVKEELTSRFLNQVKTAVKEISDNYLIPVKGTEFSVGKDHMGISVWGESCCETHCYNEETAAFYIATA